MGKPKKMRKLIKAAKRGKVSSMYELGICWQLGRLGDSNLEKAAYWISMAALYEYEPAIDWMKDYMFDDNAGIQVES